MLQLNRYQSNDSIFLDLPLDKRTLLIVAIKNPSADVAGWHGLAKHEEVRSLLRIAQALNKQEASLQRMFVITQGATGIEFDKPLNLEAVKKVLIDKTVF